MFDAIQNPPPRHVRNFVVHSLVACFIVPPAGFLEYWATPFVGVGIALCATRLLRDRVAIFAVIPAFLLFSLGAMEVILGWDASWSNLTRWQYFRTAMFGRIAALLNVSIPSTRQSALVELGTVWVHILFSGRTYFQNIYNWIGETSCGSATYICYDVVVKRTTVFLPDELHERLRSEAFASRVSMAELIRKRLERGRRRLRGGDPLAKVEGIVRDGRLSQDIDEALYPR